MKPVWHLALLGLTACCSGQETAARWIWYPESAPRDCINQDRFLRKTFDLAQPVRSAELWMIVDDRGTLWVNGEGPLDVAQHRESTSRYDVGRLLRPGRNLIAVEARNAVGVAGAIVRLVITMADGTTTVVNSDETWRVAKTAAPGWTGPGFADDAWVAARLVGSAYAAPWAEMSVFVMEPFITAAEAEAHAARLETLLKLPAGLAEERPVRAELKPHNGAPALFLNGAPRPCVMYRGTGNVMDEHGRRQITQFRDAGVHMFVVEAQMEKGWLGPGQYDFAAVDRRLRAYLAADPAAYLLLQVRLSPPTWWMETHPTEWVGYATSDRLDSHDDSHRARRASPASAVWRTDAGAAWEALIRHLEQQPWGKRVIGYHAGYGIYTEWHYYGSWTNQYPDTGPAMTRTFRAWLKAAYGEVTALREAWRDPQVDFDTAQVPGVEPRRDATLIAFRDLLRERPVMDYYRCQQRVIADDIEYFARLSKQATGRRTLYGVYYGYFFGVHPQTQGGHLELERLLRSPDIDYFVAPYDYGHRLVGEDGRLRSLAAAIGQAGKVHIIESDTRTHLHTVEEYGRVHSLTESLAVVRREFTTALTEHTGFWYVDFGPELEGGWFDDPQIMAQIGALQTLAQRALALPRRSAAEVALICDLESGYYLGDGEGMAVTDRMLTAVGTEMYHLGVPFDGLLLSQLATADLSRYRVLVFLNTFAMTDAQVERIQRLRDEGMHAMVFVWAPGLCGPGGIAAERAERATGIKLSLVSQRLAGIVRVDGDTLGGAPDPLVRDLPVEIECGIRPTSRVPVAGFDDPQRWTNPRRPQAMKASYRRYEVVPIPHGVRWSFDTSDSWTDIHFTGDLPEAEGLSLKLQVTGGQQGLTCQCVIKDANWAEFATPVEPLAGGEARLWQYPLAAFRNAPWAQVRPAKPTLPLRGMKFVMRGTQHAGLCEVSLSELCAVQGEITRRELRTFGEGQFGPALVPTDASCRVLGRIAGSAHPGLVARGEGTGLTMLCAVPFLPREVLAAVVREAGVHRYGLPAEDVVRADSRFLVVHSKAGGGRRLNLPAAGELRDALTLQPVATGREVDVTLPPDATTVWELLQPAQ